MAGEVETTCWPLLCTSNVCLLRKSGNNRALTPYPPRRFGGFRVCARNQPSSSGGPPGHSLHSSFDGDLPHVCGELCRGTRRRRDAHGRRGQLAHQVAAAGGRRLARARPPIGLGPRAPPARLRAAYGGIKHSIQSPELYPVAVGGRLASTFLAPASRCGRC
jgi:hypothetical protein